MSINQGTKTEGGVPSHCSRKVPIGFKSGVAWSLMTIESHSRSNSIIKFLNGSQCTDPNVPRALANVSSSSVRSSPLTKVVAHCGRCTSGIPYVSQSDSIKRSHPRTSVCGGSYSGGWNSLRMASSAGSDSRCISWKR